MKSFVTKIAIAIFGLSLASAPLAASAAQWGVGIGIGGGGGVAVRAGYHNGWHEAPPPAWHDGYYHHPYYERASYGRPYYGPPAYPVYTEGYYGRAPGGFYGYYSRGHWYSHRRWNGGVYLYF